MVTNIFKYDLILKVMELVVEQTLKNIYNVPKTQFEFLQELDKQIRRYKNVELQFYNEVQETKKGANIAYVVVTKEGNIKELYVNLPLPAYLKGSYYPPFILPSNVGELGALEKLVLEEMGMKSLPESITKLKLKYFSFKLNDLKELPELNAEQLEDFDISYNNLTCLPDSMCSKEGLVKLSKLSNHEYSNYFRTNGDGDIILNNNYLFKKIVTYKLEKQTSE
ncbi:MAG: hypothetical protein WC376_04395 [Candidatus Nanoarchaeia archaeon]|jgi:hypothetical protein